ncbi:MAG: ChaN family lipoprotein [Bacteroidales bacterium]|jgi:uncharacterized iron-regulated protein|nr:ChaN family lipoprotein [Bacteroidales bacterium]NLM92583.1 ChaN family lipoprotein [Bacteroidales bacterium]
MKKIFLFLALSISFISGQAGEKPAYRIFDRNGQPTDFNQLFEAATKTQVVLFGELHNNPIAHWLQLELTRELYQKTGQDLVLGAEMFEADNQLILDEYLSGLINERNFKAEAKLWNNYDTDYQPLVEFALQNQLPFIATNIPRRYASLVNRQGFEGLDALPADAKRYMAPLPPAYDPELPGYKAMLEMGGMPGNVSDNFPKAQAIKDATMAHFIYKNLNRSGIFIHYHGAYHSNNFEGIYWYLNQLDEKLKMLTISTVEQQDPMVLDEGHAGLADFIIVVPVHMTKTY